MGQAVGDKKTVSLEVGVRDGVGVGELVAEGAKVWVGEGAMGGKGVARPTTGAVGVGNLIKLEWLSEKESIKAPSTKKPDTSAARPPMITPLNPQSPLRI